MVNALSLTSWFPFWIFGGCFALQAIHAFPNILILKFFQYPFGIFLLTSYPVICGSYHFEVVYFAQVLALQIPVLHFNNIFVRSLSCETIELGVQPDETVGKLVLLIVTSLPSFFGCFTVPPRGRFFSCRCLLTGKLSTANMHYLLILLSWRNLSAERLSDLWNIKAKPGVNMHFKHNLKITYARITLRSLVIWE